MVSKVRPIIFAICPKCGGRLDLSEVPKSGPRCEDCDELMSVFAPSRRAKKVKAA